jgi:AAA domain-containing protein
MTAAPTFETRDGRILAIGSPEAEEYQRARAAARAQEREDDREAERALVGPLFERMSDIRENWGDRVIPWVVPDMVFYGGVTMVSGSPKSGKSTLVADMVRAREERVEWLGRNVAGGTTILLTEEGGYPVVNRWAKSGDLVVMQHHVAAAHYRLDTGDFVPASRFDQPEPFIEWALRHVQEAIADTPDSDHPLVIVDTLAVWSGIEDENDASETTQAVARWTELAARTRAAVIIVHHSRKGGGQYGESIRGSGAILATVAMSMELSHYSETSDDRRLDVRGRVTFGERLRLAFDRETGQYSVSSATDGEDRADLIGYLSELPESVIYSSAGVTATEAAGLWGCARNTALGRLNDMEEAGLVKKGQPRKVARNMTATWQAVKSLPPGFHDRERGNE